MMLTSSQVRDCVMVEARHVEFRIQQLRVLVVDDNAFARKIVRSLLTNIGVK
jgi:PleD family two-component response regulator